MSATVKLNPTRVVVPSEGLELRLLMESLSNRGERFVRRVETVGESFEVHIMGSKWVAQNIKRYINNNI